MKIVYPMQLAGEGTPKEIASLDEFISQLNKLNSGTFPIGRNRIWHGGVHLSEKGGWHSSGAVRAIADGEIVAYRFATEPAKATRKSEAGEPEHEIDLYTSPSFCLIRHRYEAGEKNKNSLTFYSLYMHIACENSYSAEPERYVVASNGVPIYKGAAEMQLKAEDKLGVARKGAEIILIDKDNPSVRSNEKNESQPYQLAHYAVPKAGDPELFYIAAKYINAECKTKPNWLIPPESKPARYTVPNNTWLRKTADSTEESTGVPASSEVVLLGEQQMVTINGALTDFRQVQVFKVGNGTVKNSANQVMANASKGSIGWLAKNKFGAALTAESSIPIEFDKVVLRDSNPIAVQAGEVIGHWGEHQVATLSMSGFSLDPDQKAVHFEVFVGEKDKHDKQELNDCIQNKAQVTGGQDYLVLNKDKVATYRLINHKKQLSYEALAKFGPLNAPLAVKKTDIVTHGTQKFVRVRERAAEKDELAGEFVLLASDAELLSQHDWGKLGVKLVDGSNDPDGFLDKEDTEGQEGGAFFSSIYDRLIIDRDNDNVLSGDEIKSALADDDLAIKLRQLFIKHESEWIKREKGWPRLEKELAKQPELYKYAMQVHNNMAWVEEAKRIFGGNKMWFIHPAGMMELVNELEMANLGCACYRDLTLDELKALKPAIGISDEKLQGYLDEFNRSFNDFGVKTCVEKAHFLAQVFHESGSLYYTKEEGGSAQDYSPWYGRGLIQITFESNYKAYGKYVGEDVTSSADNRDKLTVSPHIVKSAYWYVYVGKPACKIAFASDDLLYSTMLINGGLTHYMDRVKKLNLAINKFGDPSEFVKNSHGEYRFEESKIYNKRIGALAWGIWNDIGTKKYGVSNNKNEALKGYRRFLHLLEVQPFTKLEGNKKWYGRFCRQWRGYVEQRISLLERDYE